MSRPKNDEGYMGNPNVKRDGVEAEFTEEQIKSTINNNGKKNKFSNKYYQLA